MKYRFIVLILIHTLVFANGCIAKNVALKTHYGFIPEKYSIQVGAFRNVDNAGRLVDALNEKGLDAFLFRENKIYKVRFGNYSSNRAAHIAGTRLKQMGKIGDFFVVKPESFPINRYSNKNEKDILNDIVRAAYSYIGVPYVWGGTSSSSGFDCSGLTRAVYRLNGIAIPRVSRDQYSKGVAVKKRNLRKGDLVFFSMHRRRRVDHVGIYVGRGKFIHAPRTGKTVTQENLNSGYWKKVYLGARRYV